MTTRGPAQVARQVSAQSVADWSVGDVCAWIRATIRRRMPHSAEEKGRQVQVGGHAQAF